ncbi:MAG: cytochrome c [Xanthobacteraceae bacterium]
MRPILLGIVIAAASICSINAKSLEHGRNEYVKSCQPCHGKTGEGDGPRGKNLATRPSDLTKLSEANKGVFPFVRVYEVIDGSIDVVMHGPRDMPVWGDVYRRDVQSRLPGNSADHVVDAMARRRILELIEYISTIQRQ